MPDFQSPILAALGINLPTHPRRLQQYRRQAKSTGGPRNRVNRFKDRTSEQSLPQYKGVPVVLQPFCRIAWYVRQRVQRSANAHCTASSGECSQDDRSAGITYQVNQAYCPQNICCPFCWRNGPPGSQTPVLDEARFWRLYLQAGTGATGPEQKMSLFVFHAMLFNAVSVGMNWHIDCCR